MMYSKNQNAQNRREKTARKSAQENMSPSKSIQRDKIKETSTDKRSKRRMTWFKPPYGKKVSTNIGNKFFSLLSSFPPENKLYKIINNSVNQIDL